MMDQPYLDLLSRLLRSNEPEEEILLKFIQHLSTISRVKSVGFLRVMRDNDALLFDKQTMKWNTITLEEKIGKDSAQRLIEIAQGAWEGKPNADATYLDEPDPIHSHLGVIFPLLKEKDNSFFFVFVEPFGEKNPKVIDFPVKAILNASFILLDSLVEKGESRKLLVELEKIAKELQEAYTALPEVRREPITDTLEQSTIDDAIPVAFWAYMDETLGPTFLVSDPPDFAKSENLMNVVGPYSVIDFDLTASIGHVFSSSKFSTPTEGTMLSLFFVVPNPMARGEMEMHSLHVFISHIYENAMIFASLEIRALMFQYREEYLKALESFGSSLVTDEIGERELEYFRSYVRDLLSRLREDTARYLLGILGYQSHS